MRYSIILDTVGRTPVMRIAKLAPSGTQLYAKLEPFNPDGFGEGPARDRRHRGG